MYVTDRTDDKIYAYNMPQRGLVPSLGFQRDPGEDFDGIASPRGLWAEPGSRLYVLTAGNINAYRFESKVRVPDEGVSAANISRALSRDSISDYIWKLDRRFGAWYFNWNGSIWRSSDFSQIIRGTDERVVAGTLRADRARALWSPGSSGGGNTPNPLYYVWGSRNGGWRIAAVRWVGRWTVQPDLAFDIVGDDPRGIWSDGTTMWVISSGKVFAYNLAAKARDPARDNNALRAAGNNHPSGIHVRDDTMWISDTSDNKIYAYRLPGWLT